jgi:hypothetical protein
MVRSELHFELAEFELVVERPSKFTLARLEVFTYSLFDGPMTRFAHPLCDHIL